MNPIRRVTTGRSDSRSTLFSAHAQTPLSPLREAIAGTGARQIQFSLDFEF
jgi:hypothetical protein